MKKILLSILIALCMLIVVAYIIGTRKEKEETAVSNVSEAAFTETAAETESNEPDEDETEDDLTEAEPPNESALEIKGGGSRHRNTLYYAFKIKNTDKTYAFSLPSVTVTAYDKSGRVLGTDDATMWNVLPGEEQCYCSQMSCKRKYSKLEFEVDGFTDTFIPDEDNIPMSEFKISKVSIQKSLIGEKITGILANNSSKKTDNVSVAILMYKKGKIIGGDNTYIDKIKPGKKKPFEINTLHDFDYDKYEMYAFEWI